jgi:hypothetical protein
VALLEAGLRPDNKDIEIVGMYCNEALQPFIQRVHVEHVGALRRQATGKIQQLLEGDTHVVNCLEMHPVLPLTMATSGGASPTDGRLDRSR